LIHFYKRDHVEVKKKAIEKTKKGRNPFLK